MLKNISQPTNTIINEIIDYFETTDETYFCITWGQGCVLFKKYMIENKTGFYIGYTSDWLGRFKEYSDVFTRKNLPVEMFNFIGFVNKNSTHSKTLETVLTILCILIYNIIKDKNFII